MKQNLFFFSLLIGLTAISSGCVQGPDFEEEERPNSNTTSLTDGIIAHRGNSGEFPENTIIAFQSAINLGVDWAELDVRMTKDSMLVVIHDENTDRTGDKNLVVPESTYNQLLEVDVASDYRERMGLGIHDFPPQQIPLLEEVLHLFLNQSRTRIALDLKVNVVEETVELIQEVGADHMVGFLKGNFNWLRTVKELSPNIPVFFAVRDVSEIEQEIMRAKDYGFESMLVHQATINESIIEMVKAEGIEAGTSTVNNTNLMKSLLLMGVERIITDHPATLIELKREDPDIRDTLTN